MLNTPRQGLKAGLPVWKAMARNPLKVSHYLYFLGSQYVTADGGAVSAWADAGLSSGLSGPVRALAQSTANLQPTHDASDNHLTFDTVTGEKDKLAFNTAVEQAGVLVTATSNGIFAYEVGADSVGEITALGWETGYYQALDLYAYILFPTSITDVELAGVIRYLDENTGATKNPVGSLQNYFRSRRDIVTHKLDAINFSGVTSMSETFDGCYSIASFPALDLSGATSVTYTWRNCSGMTSFGNVTFSTDAGDDINFNEAWRNCASLASFPALNISRGTSFRYSWYLCTSLTSFPTINMSAGTDFSAAWESCTSLATMPAIALTAGTDFTNAWKSCTALTSFLATGLDSGTIFTNAWRSCAALETFPAIPLTAGTNFNNAWYNCTSLTSFLATGLDSGTNFHSAWKGCTALTSFPALDLSAGTNFGETWKNSTSLVTWNKCTFGASASFQQAWRNTGAMTSFPSDVDLSMGTDFWACWYDGAIVSFPALDLSAGGDFNYAFGNNPDMVSFGACNMNAGRGFGTAWSNNTALTTFPAGVFDDWAPTSVSTNCFYNSWRNCTALTEQSVENILLSIAASGVHPTSDATASGTIIAGKEIDIESNNVNVDNLTASNRAACTALQSRGWEVVINGSVVNEYALSFDGVNEYVDTGFQPDFIHSNATLSYWVKMADFSDTQIMGCHNSKRFYCGFNSQTVAMGVQDTNNIGSGADLSSFITAGKWHHIAMVANGGTATYYLDGIARDTMSYTQASASNPDTNFFIGGTSITAGAGVTYVMEGEIDEVAIWNVALDADAVAAVYNSGQPINLNRDKGNYNNSDDIVSWWRMGDSDSGAGNFVTDVIATDGEALHLDGTAGNDASIPDTADLDGFGAFTFEVDATLGDWTPPSLENTLMSKYDTSSQRAWYLALTTGGIIVLVLSEDGTSPATSSSTVPTGLADGARAKIRASRTASAGVITFEVDSGSGFVQLGATVANARGTLHNSTAGLFVGSRNGTNPVTGKIHRARVWNTATPDSSTPVLDINFALANKGATSFTATSGQEVTVHSTAIDNPAAIRGATDGVLVNSPTFVVDNPPNYSNYSVLFDGTNDYMDVGDGELITSAGTISLWIKVLDFSAYDNAFDTSSASLSGGIRLEAAGSGSPTLKIVYATDVYGGIAQESFPSAGFVDDQWGHVVITWSGSTIKGYANGVESFSNTDLYTSFIANKLIIGAGFWWNSTWRYFNGNIDEPAIWTSALTSAQINDIYNGGVPASLTSLSPVGWWRMGENNAGTGTTITDQGSGENDGTLVNTPTFSRSVPAEDAVWNNRSLTFDGVDQYTTSSADDTLATKTYSFWAKSDDTTTNYVFDHGATSTGAFRFNVGDKPLLYLNSNCYQYWTDVAAQDDNAWHHWVLYVDPVTIQNSALYCDGVLQTRGSAAATETANPYTTGIRIGRGGTGYFDGSLDEFAIFDGELTPSQVLQIYNGGKPASLKEFSPDSWWRMGDDDDTGGTTIRDLGVVSTTELISNGEFAANITGWTDASTGSASIAHSTADGGKLTVTGVDLSNRGKARQTIAGLTVGARYKVKFTASGTSNEAYKFGSSSAGSNQYSPTTDPWTTSNNPGDGTWVFEFVATTTNLYIEFQEAGNATVSIDNISVKQDDLVLNGGFDSDTIWTKGTGWSISGGTAVFATSSNSTISQGLSVTEGRVYQIVINGTITSGSMKLENGSGLGDDSSFGTLPYTSFYRHDGGTDDIKIRTIGASIGVLTDVSVKQINGNPATLVNTPTFSIDIP